MSLILSGTNGLSDVDGTAATPAIRGTDANTGIFFPAADTVAAAVGGVEGMRLTTTGLGIGTSSPNSKLQVNSGTNLGGVLIGFNGGSSNFYDADLQIWRTGNGTERMRLDSSGQVGIGFAPLSTQGNLQVFKNVSGGAPATSGATDANQVASFIGGSSQLSYGLYPSGASWIQQRASSNFAVNYNLVLQPNGGNVGIGTSSPAYKLQVNAASTQGIVLKAGNADFTEIGVFSGGSDEVKAQMGAIAGGADKVFFGSRTNHPVIFNTNDTERARIDSSGNLLVARTSASFVGGPAKFGVEQASSLAWAIGVNANGNAIVFNHTGNTSSTVGSISITTSATSYNTSSDYRLKNTIAPMTGALAKVAALKPVIYKWNIDGSVGEGFIAHELAEVVPQCVTGAKDAVDADGKPVYQGIDTSFLVATLTSAIQEQQAMIEQLKADVAALKGTV